MKYDKEENPVYTSSELSGRLSDLGGKIGLPCMIALIYGIVRLSKFYLRDWQGITISIGAIFSMVGAMTYQISVEFFRNKKSWTGAFLGLLGFIPYLFGCFLVFYKGFWSFKYLFGSFSFWGLIVPVIWILLGYRIVSQVYIMTELGRAIDEGKIKIEDEVEEK